MKKVLIFIAVILVLVGGFYYYTREAAAPTQSLKAPTPTPTQTTQGSPTPTQGSNPQATPYYTSPDAAQQGEAVGSDIQVYEVAFNGSSFEPAELTIKSGDYVFFVNNSVQEFWPKSTDADHPSMDPGKVIKPESQYKFQFLKPGTWNYNDKLHLEIVGKIIVKP